MAIPSYVSSMVANYRSAFERKFGREYKGSDETIWAVCNEIFDDADIENQENDRLEVMLERERIQ